VGLVPSPPGQSIKTRVEARHVRGAEVSRAVRLDNPLKQGLKLRDNWARMALASGPPGQSIKTRVEAGGAAMNAKPTPRPPGQSIKTRVEARCSPRSSRGSPVRLDNPLKQGLKPGLLAASSRPHVRLDNPLKQGLKLLQLYRVYGGLESAWTIH